MLSFTSGHKACVQLLKSVHTSKIDRICAEKVFKNNSSLALMWSTHIASFWVSLKLGLQTSVMQRRIWQGDSKFPPLWKGTACVACKFQWRNLRSYLSWVMPMTFTWSPPNVSTTSWCQLKSTKEYSPTNASIDRMGRCLNCTTGLIFKTLPKAQRTRGLSSAYQSNFFRSYHKFLHKSWSNIFRISTKHQLQNLNQASAFWRNLNLKLLTKPIFRILTKIELHNHMKHQQQNNDQTSASKSCLNINFKILTKPWNLVLKVWTKN